jgi:hypothetical protein
MCTFRNIFQNCTCYQNIRKDFCIIIILFIFSFSISTLGTILFGDCFLKKTDFKAFGLMTDDVDNF